MEINLRTKMPFGKYKGEVVDEMFEGAHRLVVQSQISYFYWIEKNTQHTLTKELHEFLRGLIQYYNFGNVDSSRSSRRNSGPRTDLACSDKLDGNNPYYPVE